MIRLAVRVRRADAELVLAELIDLAPSGVEEVELDDRSVEFAVYGSPGELPELPDLRAAAGASLVEISTSDVPADWQERWKSFHQPVLIEPPSEAVPAIHIRPPWEPASRRPATLQVVIDPGRAFGTGAHATTQLCLGLLLELSAELDQSAPGAAVDLGAGSGVLAIAAAKLGYGPVIALDNDPASVAAVGANAGANGVSIDARQFDLRRESLPAPEGRPVTLALANLLAPLLLALASELTPAPQHLLAGGLLREQVDEVAGAFAQRAAMRERARRHNGEWSAIWLCAGEP